MTSRSLFFSCLSGEESERTPVMIHGRGRFACDMRNITNAEAMERPELAAMAQIQFLEMCATDDIEVMYDGFSPVEACGSKVKHLKHGLLPMIDPKLKSIDMVDDLEAPDIRTDGRFKSSYKMAEILVDWGDSNYFTYSTIVAPFTLAGELIGLKNFLFNLLVEPDQSGKLIRFATDVIVDYIEDMSKLSIDGVFFIDPTSSGNFIDASQHIGFAIPSIKRCTTRCRAKEKVVIWHICGDSLENVRNLNGLGVDVAAVDEMVQLSSIGDTITDMAVQGNIAPEGLLTYGSQSDVMTRAVQCIKEMSGKRFILGNGCGLTGRGCGGQVNVENLKMLRFASDASSLLSL